MLFPFTNVDFHIISINIHLVFSYLLNYILQIRFILSIIIIAYTLFSNI